MSALTIVDFFLRMYYRWFFFAKHNTDVYMYTRPYEYMSLWGSFERPSPNLVCLVLRLMKLSLTRLAISLNVVFHWKILRLYKTLLRFKLWWTEGATILQLPNHKLVLSSSLANVHVLMTLFYTPSSTMAWKETHDSLQNEKSSHKVNYDVATKHGSPMFKP
jgi:hypothetical protein